MLSHLKTTKFITFNPCTEDDMETDLSGAELCQCLFDVYDNTSDQTHQEVNNILSGVDECCTFSCINEDIKSQLETKLATSQLPNNNIKQILLIEVVQ